MSPPSIAVLSTAWGATHGGVNSFNTDLCIALAAAQCSVCCVVLNASEADLASASRHHVRLLSLGVAGDDFPESLAPRVPALLAEHGVQPTLWIGHDLITGPPLLAARPDERVPAVLFHHMHYLSYKALESDAVTADQKHAAQRAVLSRANLVVGVGPKLASGARDLVRARGSAAPPVIELVPGLPVVEALPPPSQFQLYFAGRLDGRTARLKQVKLAIAAFGQAVSLHGTALGRDPILTLLGGTTAPETIRALEDLTHKYAGRRVTVHTLPFTNSRDDLLSRLRDHSAAMLLSVHEGFGLTAWEAIGASVPLIISINSGVHDLLARDHGGSALGCLQAVDIKASADPDTPAPDDISNVAERIARIARDPILARRDADKLRQQLSAYTWDNAARTLLKAALGFEPAPARAVSGPSHSSSTSSPISSPPAPSLTAASAANPLFDIYRDTDAPFYLGRDIDESLTSLTSGTNIWLWGPPGHGKTSAIRRCLMSQTRYLYVSTACCLGETAAGVFSHIFGEVKDSLGAIETIAPAQHLPSIIHALAGLLATADSPVVVHIDELPLDDVPEERNFAKGIAALLIEHAALTPSQPLRLAVSSISDPVPYFGLSQAKVMERLAAVYTPKWTRSDLGRLLDLICPPVGVAPTLAERNELLDRADGSPRFVKNVVRKLKMFAGIPEWPFARMLTETSGEAVS